MAGGNKKPSLRGRERVRAALSSKLLRDVMGLLWLIFRLGTGEFGQETALLCQRSPAQENKALLLGL